MSWKAISITIERATEADDGYGNKTKSWAAVAGLSNLTARRHFRTPNQAFDYNAVGGGNRLESNEFYRLDTLDASVTETDRINEGGVIREILKVRRYDHSVQIDVHRVS